MDKAMIEQWNSQVRPGDEVYHLGDFAFYRDHTELDALLDQLNGTIYLIQGNHDETTVEYCWDRFKWIKDMYITKIHGVRTILCHYPLMEWEGAFNGTYHLHGHSHNQWPQSRYRRLDVGVDGHGMKLWHEDEIRDYMAFRFKQDPGIYRHVGGL